MLRWRIVDTPSRTFYLEQMMAGAKSDVSRGVLAIHSPTLVLHGDDDRVIPVDNGVALAQTIPDAKLRVFEDAGHLVLSGVPKISTKRSYPLEQGSSQKATPPPAR